MTAVMVAMTGGVAVAWSHPLLWGGVLALVALAPLLLLLWPRGAGRFPGLAAAAWPYIPVFVVACVLLLGLGIGLTGLVGGFWSAQAQHWETLTAQVPWVRHLVWLWPWFPVLLAFFGLLYFAARGLSRTVFHYVAAGVLACFVLGVVLHFEAPVAGSVCAYPNMDVVGRGPWWSPRPYQAYSPCLPRTGPWQWEPLPWWPSESLTAQVWMPEEPTSWLEPRGPVPARGRGAGRLLQPPVSASTPTELLRSRIETRVVEPILHQTGMRPDTFSLSCLGLLLLLGYRKLNLVNARHTLPSIEVGPIEDTRPPSQARPGGAADANGKGGNGTLPRARDVEIAIGEHLHRSGPHIPPRVPGGSLVYWQNLMEMQGSDPLSWYARLFAVVARFASPPTGLRLTGILLAQEPPEVPTPVKGLRIELCDLRTHEIVLAETFLEETLERAVQRASFAVSNFAMERCSNLPGWAYWRDPDGSAVMRYWQGVHSLDAKPFQLETPPPDAVEEAHAHFEAAAKLSHGNALAKLQYGETLELQEKFVEAMHVYLDLMARYPRLVLARYRFACACSYVESWRKTLKVAPTGEDPWGRLRHDLSISGLLSDGQEGGKDPLADLEPDSTLREATDAFERYFLTLSEKLLTGLLRVANYDAILWLRNTEERHPFWLTVMWPPRQRRAIRGAVLAARCCVQQQLLRFRPPSPPLEERALWARVDSCTTQARRLAEEAKGATRRRGEWWGLTHYNLACFYALRLSPEKCAEAKKKKQKLASEDEENVQKAVVHLACSIRDPTGPFSSGTLWWLMKDPDLQALQSCERYAYWQEGIVLKEPPAAPTSKLRVSSRRVRVRYVPPWLSYA